MSERKQWIEKCHPNLSIREQCEILGVNRSSLYYEAAPELLNSKQLGLLHLVDEIYTEHPSMGTLKMSEYITLHHYLCSRHETRWAYKKLGLRSIAPGPHTSKPHPDHKVYPYLLRNVAIVKPCQVFSTDITYIRLRQGFVYLTAIIDWYSRFVLDWQLSTTMEADFCIETLARVLATSTCDIFNTDQGSQFTSRGFTELLLRNDIQISMDGKGRALDNIFVERLWRSVKYECVYLQEWQSVAAVRDALQKYFYFYNYKRPHQHLGGKTPGSVHSLVMH